MLRYEYIVIIRNMSELPIVDADVLKVYIHNVGQRISRTEYDMMAKEVKSLGHELKTINHLRSRMHWLKKRIFIIRGEIKDIKKRISGYKLRQQTNRWVVQELQKNVIPRLQKRLTSLDTPADLGDFYSDLMARERELSTYNKKKQSDKKQMENAKAQKARLSLILKKQEEELKYYEENF